MPEPVIERPTDVLVRVRAASINPVDWKIRGGHQRGVIRLQLPWILGLDVAGEVIAVGDAVTGFAPGDAVMGCPDWRRHGSYAEQCVLEQSLLVHKPPAVDWAQAAALPLAGLTAWQCLGDRLSAQQGQRVLVQAGAGGVGHLAIQIAKQLGAWVATTASPTNHAFVRELGADLALDYHDPEWWTQLGEVDVVLDAVGGESRARALRVVRRGGRVASIVGGLPAATQRYGPALGAVATGLGMAGFWLAGRLRGIDTASILKRTDPGQLARLAAWVEDGTLKVHVDRRFPLDDVAAAHALGERGHLRGKVVLEVA